ncbi:MAG: DUF1800 domain-containing protein [Planctomycetota bacterium]
MASSRARALGRRAAQPFRDAPDGSPDEPGGSRSADLPGDLDPIDPGAFGYDEARHLLWRAGFGGTPAQIQVLAGWGVERSVDHLINYDRVPFEDASADAFDRGIMRPPTEDERRQYNEARRRRDEDTLARLRERRQQAQRDDRRQIRQMQRWWLTRMIETPRPLEEKLTLFWHGHFATSYRTIEDSYHMYQQNRFLRDNAAGNFGDLLFGIIRDPAMLAYLDNQDSNKRRPNENLAREIMELFALGEGNYSERDIKEGARALTGYSFEDDSFVFREDNHDTGTKSILGSRDAHNGDTFVSTILRQRACSGFIAAKLYDYFCRSIPMDEAQMDRPTRGAVRDLAETLLRSRYDLRPALARLFASAHFYHASARREQIKSPAVLTVGAVRSLGTPVRDLGVLLDAMDMMGQGLLFPPSVKGWDGGRSWINTSTLFVRQNTLAFLLTGRLPAGVSGGGERLAYDPLPLLEPLRESDRGGPRSADVVSDYLLRLTLGESTPRARAVLTGFASGLDLNHPDVITGMLMLATAMPEYQLC